MIYSPRNSAADGSDRPGWRGEGVAGGGGGGGGGEAGSVLPMKLCFQVKVTLCMLCRRPC